MPTYLHSMISLKKTVISDRSVNFRMILALNCSYLDYHCQLLRLIMIISMGKGSGFYYEESVTWKRCPSSILKRRVCAIPKFLPLFSISYCMKSISWRLATSGRSCLLRRNVHYLDSNLRILSRYVRIIRGDGSSSDDWYHSSSLNYL